MEFVRGSTILEHCDANRFSIEQRLALFDTVCKAVQHAHANLVVHRDLKPDNIIVDEHGAPKLLDFGIAKMLDASEPAEIGSPRRPSSEAGNVTVTSDRRFTPQYAAPEQVRGESVTIAADVYALGLILYELLTGQRCYELGRGSPLDDARTVCDTAAVAPSRRVTPGSDGVTADALTEIARARRSDPARLRKRLSGDIDSIVLMALRKEPDRRYPSVEALREDLHRCRRGLPVAARPDSWAYRTRRFIGRNRAAVGATAAVAVILIACVVVLTTLALRLNERTIELAGALEESDAQRLAADREFRRALSAREVLSRTITSVSSADESARQRIIEAITARAEQLDNTRAPLSVDAEIATRQALAGLALDIDHFDVALEQSHRVLELTEHEPAEAGARAEAWSNIGWIHIQRGEPEMAIRALPEAIKAQRIVHAFDRMYAGRDQMTRSHVLLIEAMLMIGDFDAARQVVRENEIPESLTGRFIRLGVVELEERFGVSVLNAAGTEK